MKIIESVAIVIVGAAAIWTVVVMSRLEDPAYNPQLGLPLVVLVTACVLWATVLFAREAKEFGWGQVIISVISLIVVQVIAFFLFR